MIDKAANCPDTLIIRCPNWVGDIVMSIPALDCLRDSFPNTKIIGIVKKNAQGILRDGPWFDGFIDCDDKSWSGFWRMIKQIRDYKADMGVLLTNSVRSALGTWLGGVKKTYGYGYNHRGILLSGGPEMVRNNHRSVLMPTAESYLEICRWLGLNVPEKLQPRLFTNQQTRQRAESLFQKYGIQNNDTVIGLNPGASFGSSKCWPPEYFAELAKLCEKGLGAKILLFSGPGEESIAKAVIAKSRADIIDTSEDKIDLELLKPFIQRCNLLITNDTGPRHYAVALEVPVVVIMGPTNPDYTATNLDRTTVIRKEMDCSPCHRKVCPREHQCMTEITASEVFRAAKKLLKEQS
jgi:heptosyltransferase-2